MPAFNLPPGVSVNDPHINPDDTWETLFENIGRDCDKEGMTDMDCFTAWQLGLAAYRASRQLGAKYSHD